MREVISVHEENGFYFVTCRDGREMAGPGYVEITNLLRDEFPDIDEGMPTEDDLAQEFSSYYCEGFRDAIRAAEDAVSGLTPA